MKPMQKRFSLNRAGLRSKSLTVTRNFGTLLTAECLPRISRFFAPAAQRAVMGWIRSGTIGFLGVLVEATGACPSRALAGDDSRTLPAPTEQVVAHAGGEAATEKAMIIVNENKDDQEISLGMGDTLEVRLASQPGTGYGWQVASPLPSVLRLVEKTLDLGGGGQVPSAPGAPATAVFRFAPVGVGTGELRLVYVRPWEKESVPKKSYKLHVRVQ
jgi:predicted secreted protein